MIDHNYRSPVLQRYLKNKIMTGTNNLFSLLSYNFFILYFKIITKDRRKQAVESRLAAFVPIETTRQ